MPTPEEEAFARRVAGQDRTGTVGIRDFDQGVVETMGATVQDGKYYLPVAGVDGPPGWPGVPVVFAFPEDVAQVSAVPAAEKPKRYGALGAGGGAISGARTRCAALHG